MVFLNKHKFLDDQPCLTLSIIGTIFYYTCKYVGSISRHAERNYPAPQTHFPMSGSFNLINASSVFYYICRLDFQAPNHTPERCKWKTETQRAMEFEPMPRDRQRNLIFYRKHCLAVRACSLWCVCLALFKGEWFCSSLVLVFVRYKLHMGPPTHKSIETVQCFAPYFWENMH